MFKKLSLKLGTLAAVITPVIAVVSCGVETKTPSKENLKIANFIKSRELVGIAETQWQEKLLTSELKAGDLANIDLTSTKDTTVNSATHLTNGLDVININAAGNSVLKDNLKYFLTVQTKNDSAYVRKIGEKILYGNTKLTKTDLYTNGLLNEYNDTNKIAFGSGSKEISDEALNLIFNTPNLEIKQVVYKQIIAQKYLTTNKADWETAFKDEKDNLSLVDKIIDPAQFVLIKELISKRYFAKWVFNLPDPGFYSGQTMTYANLLTAMKAGTTPGAIAALLKPLDRTKHADWSTVPLGDTADKTDSELYGSYKEISSMSKSRDTFAFDLAAFQGATAVDSWTGFIQDDSIITKSGTTPIKLTDPKKPNTINFTYAVGLLPTYDGSNLKLTGFMGTNKAEIIRYVAMKNSGLYNKAMEFYTTKRGSNNAVFLEITQPEVKTKLQQQGVKFIEERKVD